MAIVRVIRAGPNDTLCGIAVDNGFRNCRKLRDANPDLASRPLRPGDLVNVPEVTQRTETGQTEQVHPFKVFGRPIAAIRYVHGTPDRPPEQDPTLGTLNVSNYVTDRAGNPDGSAAFPNDSVRTFEANADRDIDAFKIEVHDPRTNDNDLQVDLEALRPVYDPDDPDGRRVLRHEQFSGAERPRRSLLHTGPDNLLASRQGSSKRFRSCYLRLVVDDSDKGARSTQTLLTTDMTDEGDTQVEILDQVARATYLLGTCPVTGDAQCRATVCAPIGTDRRRLRIALHVLRQTPGGAPVANRTHGERRIRKWMRRVFAQACVAPVLLLSRDVDPPENLVAISNDTGANAAGDGELGFQVQVSGGSPVTIGPIRPTAGQTPLASAQALAALVRAPFQTRVTQNPATFNQPRGSADIVITEQSGAHVIASSAVSTDSRQTLRIARVNPANVLSWDGNNWLVGSIEQRAILKNHDSGDDRVDVFVVTRTTDPGADGEAMMSGHMLGAIAPPGKRAISQVKFSLIIEAHAMDGGDRSPYGLAHEVGHDLLEVIHPVGAGNTTDPSMGNDTQLMNHFWSADSAVGGAKRIRDGLVAFDAPAGSFNQIQRMRVAASAVLENW